MEKVLILLFATILNICATSRRPVQSKEKTHICTPILLYDEGLRRYKANHLIGQWYVPRKCVWLFRLIIIWMNLSVPVSIRKMSTQEMLLRLETALQLSSVEVNNLRILRLGGCGLGDEHVQSLLKLLKMKQVYSTLRELHLNGNHLTNKGVFTLLDGIRASRKSCVFRHIES